MVKKIYLQFSNSTDTTVTYRGKNSRKNLFNQN